MDGVPIAHSAHPAHLVHQAHPAHSGAQWCTYNGKLRQLVVISAIVLYHIGRFGVYRKEAYGRSSNSANFYY
ncbi:hypothetical protein HMPREF9248_0447 [Fannyhessea vaginae PB189-T1-4]|uniref:Uncharacterized protein n=1 Tax=Fannyhessea vaginae PB189-T1-4 TaxID=866774 RepID=A0ABN0B0V9_9ACTN|nr:hypothetical protein HMPREF9248_0447 [Fannyhessea vaginae PB189-T1-4]